VLCDSGPLSGDPAAGDRRKGPSGVGVGFQPVEAASMMSRP